MNLHIGSSFFLAKLISPCEAWLAAPVEIDDDAWEVSW